MALRSTSLFLYGYTVTISNQNLDFKASSGGITVTAVLNTGYYTLTALMAEIVRAMQVVDTTNIYTVTADRTLSGGLQNRVTISTSGAFLSLLFGSGPNIASSISLTIGFSATDQTSATSYTGSSTTGTALQTNWYGFNYLQPDFYQKNIAMMNMSSSGNRETLVYSTQKYIQVQFKYIPYMNNLTQWSPMFSWLSAGKPFEFTPEYIYPTTYYQVWHEGNQGDSSGLGFKVTEMLSSGMPNLYDTGLLIFRLVPS